MTTAKDVIRLSLGASDSMLGAYLADLSDADLLAVPVAGMNTIAWQLGHLIYAERHFCEAVRPGSTPPLPEGFEAAHSKEAGAPRPFTPFADKATYLGLLRTYRAATLAVLDALPDETLDAPSGMDFAPTVAALLNLVGVHAAAHAGQFVAARRALGKPVVM